MTSVIFYENMRGNVKLCQDYIYYVSDRWICNTDSKHNESKVEINPRI